MRKLQERLCFHTVGYLVEFIKLVVEKYRNSDRPINAASIQADIRQIYYVPMTIERGRKEIENILEEYPIFPIFVDECSFTLTKPESPSNINSELESELEFKFMLLRSLIRCLKCVPIFLSTNAKAGNVLGNASRNTTRDDLDDIWCIIWHKMPKMSEEFLRTKETELNMLLESLNTPRIRKPSSNFLKFVFKWFRNERPLFFLYAFDFICKFFESRQTVKDDFEFFSFMLEYVLEKFRSAKRDGPLFNSGQLAYITYNFWNQLRDEKVDNINVSILIEDLYVHKHIGFLDAQIFD